MEKPRREPGSVIRWVDIPPVWFLVALFAIFGLSRFGGPEFGAWASSAGWIVLIVAIVIFVWAVLEMRRAKTTVIPHRTADHLVTTGPFRFSRNPIYLADVLLLVAFSLFWQAPVGVLVALSFAVWISHHFIRGEEKRLRESFGAEFDAFRKRTRRWI